MNTLLFYIIAMAVALHVLAFEARSEQGPGEADSVLSAIAPPLVREGDFAVKLAEAFDLGEITDEDDAGQLLAEIGLSPRNGWMSDYPVTPVILAELREAVIASSESGRLSMIEPEALEAFDRLALDLGLSVDENAELEPPADGPLPGGAPYAESADSHDYYTTEGPPVMTYYPPPSYYSGYYDWVPYPFYFSRGYYPGFFILHDFHRAHRFDRHFDRNHKHKQFGFHNRFKRKFISNHHWNMRSGRTEAFRPNIAERSDSFGSARRSKFRDGAIKSDRFQSHAREQRGSASVTFRSTTKPGFPRSFNGSGRIDSRVHDRRFSRQDRGFRDSRLHDRREPSFRSSDHNRQERGDYSGSAGPQRRGNDGSFRPFTSNGRNGGNGGSFRSFNSSSRGFSGSRGGIGSGRR